MTKKELFAGLIYFVENLDESLINIDAETVVDKNEIIAFLDKEIEILNKRSDKSKEYAAKKKNEDTLIDLVYDALSDEFEPISAIVERVEREDVTVAMCTYRLSQLAKIGKAEKKDIKIKNDTKSRTVKGYRRI